MEVHPLDEHILDLLKKNGEMHSSQIFATMPAQKDNLKKRLSILKSAGKIDMPIRSRYILTSDTAASAHTRPDKELNEISNALRTAEDNKRVADMLMHLYEDVLKRYRNWVAQNVDDNTDFEQQLLFIENFKWLTAIGDKLMKRWSLEHVGYDTNTRQAQEDAKAKTEERQKAALEDAPLEEQVNVIGSFDLDTKQLIDNFPTLESISKEEEEEIKV